MDVPFWVVSLKNDDNSLNHSLSPDPKLKFIGITEKFQYDYMHNKHCVIIMIVISRQFHHKTKTNKSIFIVTNTQVIIKMTNDDT